MKFKKKVYLHRISFTPILLALYSVLILYFTVWSRQVNYNSPHDELFWSYKKWISGDWKIGIQIIGNILLFLPLGLFFSDYKKPVLIFPVILTILIEYLQRATMCGLFEYDDILNNTIGSIIGYIIGKRLNNNQIKFIYCLASMVLITIVIFNPQEPSNIERALAFHIEENGEGFAFRYELDTPQSYKILLKRLKDGKITEANALYGIKRPEVEEYFGTEYNYSFSGFKITMPDDDSQVIIRYGKLLQVPTDTVISKTGIHHINEKSAGIPKLSTEFVRQGTLLTCDVRNHYWIYQYGNALYWVVDKDFYFENEESTYIQLQLWTTQTEKLPIERLKKGALRA